MIEPVVFFSFLYNLYLTVIGLNVVKVFRLFLFSLRICCIDYRLAFVVCVCDLKDSFERQIDWFCFSVCSCCYKQGLFFDFFSLSYKILSHRNAKLFVVSWFVCVNVRWNLPLERCLWGGEDATKWRSVTSQYRVDVMSQSQQNGGGGVGRI